MEYEIRTIKAMLQTGYMSKYGIGMILCRRYVVWNDDVIDETCNRSYDRFDGTDKMEMAEISDFVV